jgi:hypothetical protein
MEINQVSFDQIYQVLLDQINKNPSEYILTKTICSKINVLPLEYSEGILGIIFQYYIIENNKKNVTELDLVKSVGRKSNILAVPYNGKTHENGKAPKFNDFNKHPIKLQKLVAAYVKLVIE